LQERKKLREYNGGKNDVKFIFKQYSVWTQYILGHVIGTGFGISGKNVDTLFEIVGKV